MPTPPAPPPSAPAAPALDPTALQQSFARFLERPENRALAEQAYAEESRAAALLAEREADARLRAAVRGLRERERRGVDAALRAAGGSPAAAVLRGVLLSLCNPTDGGSDDRAAPEGDSARLQAWLESPRVMEMVRRAAKQGGGGGGGAGGGGGGSDAPIDRLFAAAAENDSAAETHLPAHALAEALNEHARRMALGRAAFAQQQPDAALSHFSAAAAIVAGVRAEDEEDGSGNSELLLARGAAYAAQADVHRAKGAWAAARQACDAGVAALSGRRQETDANATTTAAALVSLLARRGSAHLENRDLPASQADLERAREVLTVQGPGAREAWERGALRPLAAALGAAERGEDNGERQRQRALFARMLKGL